MSTVIPLDPFLVYILISCGVAFILYFILQVFLLIWDTYKYYKINKKYRVDDL